MMPNTPNNPARLDLRPFAGKPPAVRPTRPNFSCGPTAKHPGWTGDFLAAAPLGRSHRAADVLAVVQTCLAKMRALLALPDDYRLAIVPGSNTGAVEMAMWSLLGARGVDVLGWEAFGHDWVHNVLDQLRVEDRRAFSVDYGDFPDLSQLDDERDLVFTWNGTASGVRVTDADWINPDRTGLTIVDATSAVFAMPVPIDRLDVVTFSWQKSLGGEGAHGIIILSPKAAHRLQTYTPPWPMPKLFRMTAHGMLNEPLFAGHLINTPSMMCVADAVDALDWAEDIGGLTELIARTNRNSQVVATWLSQRNDVGYLARDSATASPTSICLMPQADWFTSQTEATRRQLANGIVSLLASEKAAYDIISYPKAPPGLRIWGGPTVETSDMQALMPWLDWGLAAAEAFATRQAKIA